MRPRLGLVSTAGRDREVGRRGAGGVRAEGYLVAADGRAAWFEDGAERSERTPGQGTMLVVADGEGDTAEAARTATASTCRVMAKLWAAGGGDDPAGALAAFVADAHTRMYWKARERGTRLAASCAVAWLVGDRLHYLELGTARVWLWRDGRLHRVGVAWPAGDRQRMLGGSVGLGDDSALHLEPGRNTGTVALQPGDQVLVTTEGFGRGLDEASAAHVLQHVDDAQVAAVTLLDRALAGGALGGVTLALADLRGAAAPVKGPRTDPPPNRRLGGAVTEP